MRIASMAYLPHRKSVPQAAGSIIRQVDQLHMYRGDNNLGDANKFRGTIIRHGYIFTVDDDLLYPAGYIDYLIRKIDHYDRKAVVSLTGKTLKKNKASTYFQRPEWDIYRCLDAVEQDTNCHIIGTGVAGWHSSLVWPEMKWFTEKNIADVLFSLELNRRGIPRIVLSHGDGWLENINDDTTTCWRSNASRKDMILQIVNSCQWNLCD